jgi:hypothetical protein
MDDLMSDNLPAVRPAGADVARRVDTDSWTEVVGDVAKLASYIAETEFVPKGLRGSAAATAAAILYGREVGLGPMSSLNGIAVVDGRPTVMAEQLRAMVFAAGHEIAYDEMSGARVVVRGRRHGSDQWTKVEWNIDMARAAGLVGKNNWKNYPRAMLTARATAELCRLVFPDVTHGLHATEEIEESDLQAAAVPVAESTTKVQRRTRKATQDGAPVPALGGLTPPAPGPGPSPLPPLPGEPGYETDDGAALPVRRDGEGDPAAALSSPAAEPDDPDSPPPPPDIAGARRALHARFNELGYTKDERELRLLICMAIADEEIQTSNDLTFEGIRKILDTLARCKTREHVEQLMRSMAEEPVDEAH